MWFLPKEGKIIECIICPIVLHKSGLALIEKLTCTRTEIKAYINTHVNK